MNYEQEIKMKILQSKGILETFIFRILFETVILICTLFNAHKYAFFGEGAGEMVWDFYF